MNPNTDDLKGRAKEAVGDLTDDADLQREGQRDRAGAKAKEAVDKVAEKAKDLVDGVKDKVQSSERKSD
jgi:uncharacterized protein YjbJ (UPF0337 family)